ncbi:MAG TPA: hypothetical protein VFW22_07810 [Pseudolabrys sp.]|nr:hypothetical protein [Pseudolabrys sp.]
MTEQRMVYRNRDGVRRTLIWDDDEPNRVVVQTEQNIEPVLESVARDREIMAHNGVNRLAARVPVSIYERSVHEQWGEDDWKRWLNSAEAEPFRIWKGRL